MVPVSSNKAKMESKQLRKQTTTHKFQKILGAQDGPIGIRAYHQMEIFTFNAAYLHTLMRL